ncbi:MAG: RluA family pseudouridine synthase [Deltaproteobacteria bacterium]
MSAESPIQTFEVSPELAGRRTDVFLAEILEAVSRSQIQRLIDGGFILVDGRATKASKKLIAGQRVSVNLPEPEPIEAEPEDIEIEILHEDAWIVVVNKPAGLTVHPGAGQKSRTLVNALLFKCRGLSGIGGKIRPGIVHRLDRDTSGVIVAAKNDAAHRSLVNQFKSRDVKKRYSAIITGSPKADSGSFSDRIARHPANRVKMAAVKSGGRDALTLWRVKRRFASRAALVEAEPKTGRTHQIRVHFAENGHPLLGDRVYLANERQGALSRISKRLNRQALHAEAIGFFHPEGGQYVEYSAPMPEDMMSAISELERMGNGLD